MALFDKPAPDPSLNFSGQLAPPGTVWPYVPGKKLNDFRSFVHLDTRDSTIERDVKALAQQLADEEYQKRLAEYAAANGVSVDDLTGEPVVRPTWQDKFRHAFRAVFKQWLLETAYWEGKSSVIISGSPWNNREYQHFIEFMESPGLWPDAFAYAQKAADFYLELVGRSVVLPSAMTQAALPLLTEQAKITVMGTPAAAVSYTIKPTLGVSALQKLSTGIQSLAPQFLTSGSGPTTGPLTPAEVVWYKRPAYIAGGVVLVAGIAWLLVSQRKPNRSR